MPFLVAVLPLVLSADIPEQPAEPEAGTEVSPVESAPCSSDDCEGEAQGEPRDEPALGDVFVEGPPDTTVWVDGQPTGQNPPVLLSAVSEGPHVVELRDYCRQGSTEVVVRAELVTRTVIEPTVGTGALTVDVVPANARVLLDGEVLEGPREGLSCGVHSLVVQAQGFHPQTHEVVIEAYETTQIAVELDDHPGLGTLVVLPTPLEAIVTLDGEQVGSGPRTLEGLQSGVHDLDVTASGYQPFAQQVEVRNDGVERVEVRLERADPNAKAAEPTVVILEPAESSTNWLQVGARVAGGGALVTGAAAGISYRNSRIAYVAYSAERNETLADFQFEQEVQPARMQTGVLAGSAATLALASGVLWYKGTYVVVPTATSITISGSF